MLFCDTSQRSLDDLPALNVAWYRWTARVCFTCSLALTLLKQNVMRIVVFCHAWVSRPASSSGELLPCVCVWRRAEGVNLFMTWGFVTIQACLFLLRHSYFCFSSTSYFFEEMRHQKQNSAFGQLKYFKCKTYDYNC